MWYWIAGCFGLFILFEESIYYFWNRYVFGPKEERIWIWKQWNLVIAYFRNSKKKNGLKKDVSA